LSLTVFTQRNFVADFLQAKCDFERKTAVLRFWAPFGGLGATYDDHLRLIRKRVVDFLLYSVNWTFSPRFYGWGATSECQLKIGDFAPTRPVDPKFQVEGIAPTNHSSSQKTRLNGLSYGIKTDLSSVLLQCTRLTDRRTDRILIARPSLHSTQRGKNVIRVLQSVGDHSQSVAAIQLVSHSALNCMQSSNASTVHAISGALSARLLWK